MQSRTDGNLVNNCCGLCCLIPFYVIFKYTVSKHGFSDYHRKELGLLQKLYGLYDAVMNTISGYYSILWTDVDIDKINTELLEFQNRYSCCIPIFLLCCMLYVFIWRRTVWLPGVVSCPKAWGSGRPSWILRKGLMISMSLALCWKWWQTNQWLQDTGSGSQTWRGTGSMWSLTPLHCRTLWKLLCWTLRRTLRLVGGLVTLVTLKHACSKVILVH